MHSTTGTRPPTPATAPDGARLVTDVVDIDGDPGRVGSNFINGIAHLPVRTGD